MFGETEGCAALAKDSSAQVGPLEARRQGLESIDGSQETLLQQFGKLCGACPQMRELFRVLDRLGPSDAPVMILGESGAGKELVARTLHELSPRSQRPFVAINCGALPENLIESELFGHERGSFTGAARTHRGCFERADSGTLLLDEVTEMPIEMQVRLLRVLETGGFSRVGGDQEIATNVRVLATSNRDMQQAVASGRLREDLMYRLCVIPVIVPPLRARGEDAILLAEKFLAELNAVHAKAKILSAEARHRIASHAWPGNVRELKNVIHRAFVLSDHEVQVDVETMTIASDDRSGEATACRKQDIARDDRGCIRIAVGTSLDDAERALITATLRAVGGRKTEAARMLGVSLKTIYNRLHAYGETGLIAERRPLQSECAAQA
jgi:DNA-binding NtrC family response regulator